MTPSALIVFVYAVLTMVGGIFGFVKAGSRPSLISGLISGLLLLAAGYGLLRGQSWGLPLAVVLTSAILVFFGIRFAQGHIFMPAGLMVILSILTLAGVLLTRGR